MISQILTACIIGLDVYKIQVEADVNNSLPSVAIVGLPDTAISEARERVRSAIKNSGYSFPAQKVVINLAPADIKKIGSGYDLPIAVGILAKNGEIQNTDFSSTAFIGELSLDGSLRAVSGILSITAGLKEHGIKTLIVPYENAKEAAIIQGITIYGAKNLNEIVNHFNTKTPQHKLMEEVSVNIDDFMLQKTEQDGYFDFKDVKGQLKAKKALEIAAAGAHNLLMSGSPGSGKTMLAKCFPSILPPLTFNESMELTKIYSITGLLNRKRPLITSRPFRSVHHTASAVGITGGGGANPVPGEITLAHRGVLFLDEFAEFPRSVLEVLRQPLEDGKIVIARAKTRVEFPSDFILLAAMNPCPCGYLGDSQKQCTCTEHQIKMYRSKLSGPLLDRIDMIIDVPHLNLDELTNDNVEAESSEEIRQRVVKARNIQLERYKGLGIYTNSELTPKLIKKYCKPDEQAISLLKSAAAKFNLSARAYDRLLKLSRTIADLEGNENISAANMAHAIQYRSSL